MRGQDLIAKQNIWSLLAIQKTSSTINMTFRRETIQGKDVFYEDLTIKATQKLAKSTNL